MSHNARLDELLAGMNKVAKNAKEEKDFKPIFSAARNFIQTVGPIAYDNRAKWWVFLIFVAVGGGFAYPYFTDPDLHERIGPMGVIFVGVCAAVAVAMLIAIGMAGSVISEVSDLIFEKDVFFDNRLKGVNIEGRGRDLYEQYRKEFGDFRNRGDEDRYIKRLVRGEYAGKEHSFGYDYYVFHYVRVYYVPVTRRVGKSTYVTMERRTETLYRRGIITDFPFAKGIVLQSGGGSYDYSGGFQPTSQDFVDVFAVGAESAHEAAKFLKPVVVLACVEFAKYFSGLNIEVNRNGRMNIAFKDGDVLDLERKFSIAEPDEFEREIGSHLALSKLRLLMQFVETLRKHNDSNF